MTDALRSLLTELESFGQENDRSATDRASKMLNITRDTGEFLAVLVKATVARRILEIGTSNGYSTLWLAWAAESTDGEITTVEIAPAKAALAAANYTRAGLAHRIHQRVEDAGVILRDASAALYDLVFLDSNRGEYLGWWEGIKQRLRPGGLLVVDNATSHPEELAAFIAKVEADPDFTTSLVPVGNGEFLAVKNP